jgi:ABC-type branched-subunit amino acid transport system substrate-binding protein
LQLAAAEEIFVTRSQAFVQAFSAAAERAGVSIIKSAKITDFNPDFRTEIATIKASKAGMLLTTWRPEVALQRMEEQNYRVRLSDL